MASAVDVASRHYPFLPTRLLMKDTFYSVDHIDAIDMPLLIMHGDRDTIIPVDSGRALFAEAKQPKSFIELEGAGHNDLYRYPTVDHLGDFLSAGAYLPNPVD